MNLSSHVRSSEELNLLASEYYYGPDIAFWEERVIHAPYRLVVFRHTSIPLSESLV